MAQQKPEWKEIDEFVALAEKLIAKFPERFKGIDVSKIVAYGCTNKKRPEKKLKPYEMSGETEPECFTNSKQYFVKFFMEDWNLANEELREWLVFSSLERIDLSNPGKVLPYDYRDQSVIVRTVGADWQRRKDLPSLLRESVEIKEGEM